MKIVSYYTKDTPYEEEAEEFKKSFDGQDYHIFEVCSLGSWELNCGQKPAIIKTALETFNQDILFLDIDARLVGPLEEIPEPNKLGICMWNPPWKPYYTELLSGTIYVPNNKVSFALLDDWKETQSNTPYLWDQKTLQSIINKYTYSILDLRWVYIKDFMDIINPIILHTQCSRRLKNLIR